MVFFDCVLNVSMSTEEKNGTFIACADGNEYPLQISDDYFRNCPDWVKEDVIKLMVRKALRSKKVDQLADAIIPDMQEEIR